MAEITPCAESFLAGRAYSHSISLVYCAFIVGALPSDSYAEAASDSLRAALLAEIQGGGA